MQVQNIYTVGRGKKKFPSVVLQSLPRWKENGQQLFHLGDFFLTYRSLKRSFDRTGVFFFFAMLIRIEDSLALPTYCKA